MHANFSLTMSDDALMARAVPARIWSDNKLLRHYFRHGRHKTILDYNI